MGGWTNNQIIKHDPYAVRENITVECVEHIVIVPVDLTVHLESRSSMKTTMKPDIKYNYCDSHVTVYGVLL